MNVNPLLILLTPILANVFAPNLRVLKLASAASGVIDVVLLALIHNMESPGFFLLDRLSWTFALMICCIYLTSTLYSLGYIEIRGKSLISEPLYYVLLNLFTATMLFTVLVNNFGLMWVGLEATTISSALLLTVETTESTLEATWRYIILVSAGITLAFVSVILLYYSFGTLTVTQMGGLETETVKLAVLVGLLGFGTKVGVFPVFTWLPDAHSEAPSPVSAMFSGVLLPSALYIAYRLYEVLPQPLVYTWVGVITALVASLLMVSQTKFKRLFAYSSIENMSIALLGLSVGQVNGALLLLLSHAFGKAGAFYACGELIKSAKTREIREVRGIAWRMKATSTSLLMSSLAVTGAPPFGAFVGEFLIMRSLISKDMILQFSLVLASLVIAFAAVNYHVTSMVFQEGEMKVERVPKVMSLVSTTVSLTSLLIGLISLGVMA